MNMLMLMQLRSCVIFQQPNPSWGKSILGTGFITARLSIAKHSSHWLRAELDTVSAETAL
jgi:hypothetical protein